MRYGKCVINNKYSFPWVNHIYSKTNPWCTCYLPPVSDVTVCTRWPQTPGIFSRNQVPLTTFPELVCHQITPHSLATSLSRSLLQCHSSYPTNSIVLLSYGWGKVDQFLIMRACCWLSTWNRYGFECGEEPNRIKHVLFMSSLNRKKQLNWGHCVSVSSNNHVIIHVTFHPNLT